MVSLVMIVTSENSAKAKGIKKPKKCFKLYCTVFCKNESNPNIVSAILPCVDLGSSGAFEILVIS